MNHRESQLRERDVRRLSPLLDSQSFLSMYMQSNFPQTAAIPSAEQKGGLIIDNQMADALKSSKKPPTGTKYDNPGGY